MRGIARKWIRRLALAAVSLLAAAILFPVVGQFFVELARERGLYEQPSARLEAVMEAAASLLQCRAFWWVAGLTVGFAAGVWIDALLARIDRRRAASGSASPTGTTPEHVAAMEAARAERLRLRKENQRLALENEREQLRQAAANKSLVNTSATAEAMTGQNDTCSLEYRPELNHHRLGEDGKQWVTVRLEFRTDKAVKNANPYLLCLRRYESGNWSADILAGMRVLLSWPGSGNRFIPRRIDASELVLLLDYDVEQHTISFVNNKKHAPFSIRNFMDNTPPGKYLLTIGVAGDDIGMTEVTFVLDWFGDIESLSLQRASKEVA
jgi:hypothetical protein